ncbi:MAG: hypothetical protein V8T87_14605 [Victivallales bacterium]
MIMDHSSFFGVNDGQSSIGLTSLANFMHRVRNGCAIRCAQSRQNFFSSAAALISGFFPNSSPAGS